MGDRRIFIPQASGASGPTDLSSMSYNASESRTTGVFSGATYGSNQFYIFDDGKSMLHFRAAYDSHYEQIAQFATAYDWSSAITTVNGGNRNPSNHYQSGVFMQNNGLNYVYGGYTNSNVAGNDDIYKSSVTTKNTFTGYSLSTYSSTYKVSANNDSPTSWANPYMNTAGTRLWHTWGYDHNESNGANYDDFIVEYSGTTAYDFNNFNGVRSKKVRDLFGQASSVLYNPSTTTGYLYHFQDMKADGTEVLVLRYYYSSGTITEWNYYVSSLTTPYDISTAQAIVTTNVLSFTNNKPTVSSVNANVGTGRALFTGDGSITIHRLAGTYGSNYSSYFHKYSI